MDENNFRLENPSKSLVSNIISDAYIFISLFAGKCEPISFNGATSGITFQDRNNTSLTQ